MSALARCVTYRGVDGALVSLTEAQERYCTVNATLPSCLGEGERLGESVAVPTYPSEAAFYAALAVASREVSLAGTRIIKHRSRRLCDAPGTVYYVINGSAAFESLETALDCLLGEGDYA